ncbi:MAG: 3-deoxy-manno-octulosonate cytidylyltransferase [Thermovibrio sp.]|nr:MAG: 3-deoxy-manno-octulosonate cytidylyltransferase [Thermovibrio sp.]
MEDLLVVIPARIGSQRLPEKPLRKICGKPLIGWVIEAVKRVTTNVLVATDSEGVLNVALKLGVRGKLTPSELPSGTDRVYYAAKEESFPFIVNVQGDEPFVDREHIEAVYRALKAGAPFSTVATPFKSIGDVKDPSMVKVVLDKRGRALYFSRSPIPYVRDGEIKPEDYLKHIGIYGYRKEALERFVNWKRGKLEELEKLEQLRILENGEQIYVSIVEKDSFGVDTEEDLKRAEKILCGEV